MYRGVLIDNDGRIRYLCDAGFPVAPAELLDEDEQDDTE